MIRDLDFCGARFSRFASERARTSRRAKRSIECEPDSRFQRSANEGGLGHGLELFNEPRYGVGHTVPLREGSTKSITATLAAMLVEDQVLRWDTDSFFKICRC